MLRQVTRLCKPRVWTAFTREFASAPIATFRTQESNPVRHDASHIGRLYTIPPDTFNTLFETSMAGFSVDFRDQCKTFMECCLMVRSPFIDIKNCIEAYDLSLPTLRYLLYGVYGAGKTVTLNHILHYGYCQGYILASVPWVPLWTKHAKEIVASSTRPGFYDHTTNSAMWLSHFRSQNTALLSNPELKTGVEYTWSKRESTPAGSSLLEIIEHGIARPIHGTECVFALITELKRLSTEGKCKTMVVIDGVNGFYYEYETMKNENRKVIQHSQLVLYEAFKQFFKSDWTGGVVVGSVDKHAIRQEDRVSDLPRQLLTKEGWEDFDPFIPIHVEVYSPQQVQTTIDYFLDRKWLAHKDAGSEKARKELDALSVRNPNTLMQLCTYR